MPIPSAPAATGADKTAARLWPPLNEIFTRRSHLPVHSHSAEMPVCSKNNAAMLFTICVERFLRPKTILIDIVFVVIGLVL